jgi:hypothetical protein
MGDKLEWGGFYSDWCLVLFGEGSELSLESQVDFAGESVRAENSGPQLLVSLAQHS